MSLSDVRDVRVYAFFGAFAVVVAVLFLLLYGCSQPERVKSVAGETWIRIDDQLSGDTPVIWWHKPSKHCFVQTAASDGGLVTTDAEVCQSVLEFKVER